MYLMNSLYHTKKCDLMVPLLGPRLYKVYKSFWNDIIWNVSTKPWTFL